MSKGSMIAAAALALAAIAAFVAAPAPSRPGPDHREAISPDRNSQWDAYSVFDYYGGEYDWPRLKLGEPATRQSIIHDLVPQIERLTPDHLARLAKQQDFCSGPSFVGIVVFLGTEGGEQSWTAALLADV